MARSRSQCNKPLDRTGISPIHILNPGSSSRLTRQRWAASSSSSTPNDTQISQAVSPVSPPQTSSISADISAYNIIGPLDTPRLTRKRSAAYVSAMRTTSTRQQRRYNPVSQAGRTAWKKSGSRTTEKRVHFTKDVHPPGVHFDSPEIYVDPDAEPADSPEADSSESESLRSNRLDDKENVVSRDLQRPVRRPLGILRVSDFRDPSFENEESAADGAAPLAPSRTPLAEIPIPTPPRETPRSTRTPPPAPRARTRANPSPSPPRRFSAGESAANQAALPNLGPERGTVRVYRRPNSSFGRIRDLSSPAGISTSPPTRGPATVNSEFPYFIPREKSHLEQRPLW